MVIMTDFRTCIKVDYLLKTFDRWLCCAACRSQRVRNEWSSSSEDRPVSKQVMSRRASLLHKENPGRQTKVRFPDELVFLDDVKDNDTEAMSSMLRRVSVELDINAIMPSGMAPLHQAVLNGNVLACSLLINHGADVNTPDEDTWTPLHAACSEGHLEIAKILLDHGADRYCTTEDGERPIDLVDPNDFKLISLMLGNQFFTKKNDCSDGDSDDELEENNEVNTNDDVIKENVDISALGT